MPSDATYNVGSDYLDDYASAITYQNSGHLRVAVSETDVNVAYVRAVLPEDETFSFQNRDVVYSYSVSTNPTSIDMENKKPQQIRLMQNYPNPFNSSTQISFQIMESQFVKLTIYNSAGEYIRTLLAEDLIANNYSIKWDGLTDNGKQTSSGIYFYEVKSDRFREIRKAILLK